MPLTHARSSALQANDVTQEAACDRRQARLVVHVPHLSKGLAERWVWVDHSCDFSETWARQGRVGGVVMWVGA